MLPVLIFLLVEATAATSAWRASRRCAGSRPLRRFWRLIALALALLCVADTSRVIRGSATPVTTLSITDVFFLSFYLALFAAILQVPTTHGPRTQRWRTALDVATVVLGLGTVVWYLVLGPTLRSLRGTSLSLQTAVTVAYPTSNLVLLAGLALILLLRPPPALRRPLAAIAGALALLIAVFVSLGTEALAGATSISWRTHVMYLLAVVTFAVAARLQRPVTAANPADPPPTVERTDAAQMVPYLAVATAFGLLLVATRNEPFVPVVSLVLGALVLAILVAARQHLAQRETAHLQRRLETIVDSVGEGIVTFTPSGRILTANRAAETAFGAEPGALVGQPVLRLLHDPDGILPQDRPDVGARRLRTGRRLDGTTFPLELVVTTADLDGAEMYVAVARDVSERERTEQAHRESEARFRAIFDNANVGIVLIDVSTAEHHVADVNAAFAAMFDRTVEELLANRFAPIRLPGRSILEDEGLLAWLAAGTAPSYRTERSFLHRDGSIVLAELNVSALRDETGRAVYAIAIIEDVTERRRIERHKDEFISVVGHELRTPLTSIRGSLGLLAAGIVGELPDEAAEMVAVAVANTDRLVRLINDMLDIERMDAGRAEMAMAPVPIEEPIGQAIQALQASADAAQIRLLRDAAPDLVVLADTDRIVQALVNLIGNAVKFSPPGGTVEITATRSGTHAVVTVRDHGRGIPAASLESIFDRFAQVDGTDARDKGGTGLGLPICQRIIEHHGGHIWAESTPGDGATFRFTLPLAEAGRQREPERSADHRPSGAAR